MMPQIELMFGASLQRAFCVHPATLHQAGVYGSHLRVAGERS